MNATGRWARYGVWGTLVVVMTIGCSPLTTIAFLFHKDEKVPAAYPLRPAEGPKHEKDQELVVLVMCEMSTSRVREEYAGMDRELAQVLAKYLTDGAKENKEKLTIIPPAKLESFKAANPNWKVMRPAVIGKRLGADVVIDVNLAEINFYQPGSGNMIYQGRANADVSVYETTESTGATKSQYPHPFIYPKAGMQSVDEHPRSEFKKMFIENLAREIAWKHIEYKESAKIATDEWAASPR